MAVKALIILALICTVLYLLYINGFISFGNKKALLFLGKNGFFDKRCRAQFSACTGEVKRVITFKESRTYSFDFNCKLTSGELRMILRNRKKEDVLILDCKKSTGTIEAVSGERYYIVFEFYKAYGSYELTWK